MYSRKQLSGREGQIARYSAGSALGLILAIGCAGAANAQELTHRFINPSFGGNPFYSDHLLSIANIHRPAEPEEPTEEPPSEEELIASQIRARLLSGLSGEILDRIEFARPGQSGEFEFGDQRISFIRTATETQVTFVNTRTGETRRIVIPVQPGGSSGFAAAAAAAAAPRAQVSSSAEQALGAGGTSPAPLGRIGLLSPPPL
jgi:curli production assembly/transport component CsgF